MFYHGGNSGIPEQVIERKRYSMAKKFLRSKNDRVIWGICGGLAKYFDIDPTIVRVVAVASLFVGTLGFWIYILLALIVPVEPA